VAVGATVSELVGLIAAALPDGARVLAPDVEFTSLLFPFMVHADRGVEVATVPTERLAEAVDASTDVVAFSVVQSATGEIADIDGIVAAARHHGALTIVDATQACGWLPLADQPFDALACAAYKWLMSPRGTAFLAVRGELSSRLKPLHAGWYAGEDPHATYYGPPLRLAASARRLDTSPAWFSWVGTQPALELIELIGPPAIERHDVALANRLRAGLGLEPGRSAIVTATVPDAERRLGRAGIVSAVRGGHLRACFHVYNTRRDVDVALEALTG
jgi:selenocysteine lyase/cysteine desulfurase